MNGGNPCFGDDNETEGCNTGPCEGLLQDICCVLFNPNISDLGTPLHYLHTYYISFKIQMCVRIT